MQYYMVRTDLNLDKVKISGGDYQEGALSKVMNTSKNRALALNAWMERGLGKKPLLFVPEYNMPDNWLLILNNLA